MKKTFLSLLLVVLVVGLVFGGCGEEAEPTTPTTPTAPTTPTTPAEPTAPAEPTKPAEPAEPSRVTVTAITTPGGPGFFVPRSFAAVAEAENLPISIEAIAADSTKTSLEKLEAQKDTAVITMGSYEFDKEKKANGSSLKLITPQTQRHVFCFATLDENIRTYEDITGKKVATWMGGGPIAACFEMIDTWGITDIEFSILGDPEAVAAGLLDGSIDVGMYSINVIDDQWVLERPLMVLEDPYLITWDQEFADMIPEMNGYYRMTMVIPAGTVGANQPEPVNAPSVVDYYVCDPDINPVIPYEIAKMQAEYAGMIAEQTPQGFGVSTPFVQKYLAVEPFTRDDFHPAALKYFDEAGIQFAIPVTTPPGGPGFFVPRGYADIADAENLPLKLDCTASDSTPAMLEKLEAQKGAAVIALAAWEFDKEKKAGESSLQLITPLTQRHVFCFATLDENIRTYEDITGKKVATWMGGGPIEGCFNMLDTWDITDIEFSILGDPAAVAAALLDGSIDVGMYVVNTIGDQWVPDRPLMVLEDPYLITWDQEFADMIPEMNGYYRPTMTIPAGTAGANQPEPVDAPAFIDYYVCHTDINPVIPYEIVKMQVEYAGQIAEQTPQGFGAATPTIPNYLVDEPFTRDDFHPAALKYFDKVGVQLPE